MQPKANFNTTLHVTAMIDAAVIDVEKATQAVHADEISKLERELRQTLTPAQVDILWELDALLIKQANLTARAAFVAGIQAAGAITHHPALYAPTDPPDTV